MKTTLLAASLLMAALSSFAQHADSLVSLFPEEIQHRALLDNQMILSITGGKPVSKEGRDSIESLMNIFYADQFRHFMNPQAPYLMFMSRDANFAMGVAGVVRMRGWYDIDNAIQANGFCPMLISIPEDPTHKRRLAATPAGTALVFTMFGRHSRFGNYMAYIEAGFNGYNNEDFKLKKAYVTLADWTVGYATSTFCDPSTLAPVIDGAGANGSMSKTNVLVRWLHSFKKNWSMAASIEFPNSQPDVSGEDVKKCDEWLPDIAAFGQYEWDRGYSHIRLSGLLRTMTYRDLVELKNRNVTAWALQLSTKVKVFNPFTLYGQLNYGVGHASYLNDLSIGNFDLIAKPGEEGRLYAPEALGWTLGARYDFRPNLFASTTYGQLHFFPETPVVDYTYKYGEYLAVDLFWDITPRIEVGAEWLYGRKHQFDHASGSAQRVDLLFQLSF